MKNKLMVASAMIGLAGVLGACSTQAPQPQPTVTVTQQPPTDNVTPQDTDLNRFVEVFWEGVPNKEKDELCSTWLQYPEIAEESFKLGYNDSGDQSPIPAEDVWEALEVVLENDCNML